MDSAAESKVGRIFYNGQTVVTIFITSKEISFPQPSNTIKRDNFVQGETPVGRRIVLPSSYPGSPRNMHENYLDAMAIVRMFGKPDFLITFTANPTWPEIVNSLPVGQRASNRPDIVSRVFNLKLHELLHDLTKLGVLGKAIAWSWVVEFQKRGLPHAHILLIVASEDKPRTAEQVRPCHYYSPLSPIRIRGGSPQGEKFDNLGDPPGDPLGDPPGARISRRTPREYPGGHSRTKSGNLFGSLFCPPP